MLCSGLREEKEIVMRYLGSTMFNRVATPEPRLTDPTRDPIRSSAPAAMQPQRPSLPPFAQAPSQQAMRAADTPTSVLGQDITISGQQLVLKTKGSLLIAGQIQGDVHGGSVTVGETGNVSGRSPTHHCRSG